MYITIKQTNMIDLRSDTLTLPTQRMRESMANAIVGDDVYGEDPTVQKLEKRIATIFGKESALFFPSGTMSNLTAILSWCPNRGSEIIMGDNSHMFLFEQAGAAQFGGVSVRTVPNLSNGTMNMNVLRSSIRDDDIHEPATKLICIENTHNVCGGKILPISFLDELNLLAKTHNIPIHMDGARIWNAITEMNIKPHQIGIFADSLSVCLSKGLGAPVGSLLVGTNDFIQKARRIRKALGGGMRQSGILAAAGLNAIDDFESNLLFNDHRRTKQIWNAMRMMPLFKVDGQVDTNIIFADISPNIKMANIANNISNILQRLGIRVSAWSQHRIRMVIHRDISDEDVATIIDTFRELSDQLIN